MLPIVGFDTAAGEHRLLNQRIAETNSTVARLFYIVAGGGLGRDVILTADQGDCFTLSGLAMT
jgi:hypothetical protein